MVRSLITPPESMLKESPNFGEEDFSRLFKWEGGLLAAFHYLIEEHGRARLDSRCLRNLIWNKNYVSRLADYGIIQHPSRSYCPAHLNNGKGKAISYDLVPEKINQIPGRLGAIIRFFVGQDTQTREALLSRCKRSNLKWAFMPEMRKLGEENGISMKRISRKHGNYYSGASSTKLTKWLPGVVEIDVHAMNFFSLSQLCPLNERERYLSLFQGKGFYENLKTLSGECELCISDFKKHLLAGLNSREPERLVTMSAQKLAQRDARFRDRARREHLRKLKKPKSVKEKIQVAADRALRSLSFDPSLLLSASPDWEPFTPPAPEGSKAFTFLSREFPGLWRSFSDRSRRLGPSKLSTEFFLPQQALLCAEPSRLLEKRGIGSCQRNDAIVVRITEATELATMMRECAQEHFEAQPVLKAKFSPGTPLEEQRRLKELRPDLFYSDSPETLDPGDFWPELRV